MSCFVKYMQKTMRVVRVKNRFASDTVQKISAAQLQQAFYSAESWGSDDYSSVATRASESELPNYDKMYRDIMLNLRPKGSNFICEVQLTLTGISILKKSEQKIYTLMRMTSASELLGTFVFSKREDNAKEAAELAREEERRARAALAADHIAKKTD